MATDIAWHEVCRIEPETPSCLVAATNMTNKERQQRRFERDRKRRLEKRLKIEQEYCSYDDAISIESLTEAFYGCRKGVAWKRSVQNFEQNLFQNISELHHKMDNCKNVSNGYVEFEIIERGKKRRIQACHISERVVQKSFSENVLAPMLERTLIKNNCASQIGKGTHKAWEYFEEDLKKAKTDRVFITHSGCDQELLNSVYAYLDGLHVFEEILITRAGSVISSHCGPGTLGVLFIAQS